MHQSLKFLGAAALLAGLSACGEKSGTNTNSTPNLANATAPSTVAAIKDEVVRSALPKANKATPSEEYIELSSGNQVMFTYLALAAMPIDYKEIASSYSQDYARASDEFRKNDLLTALQPKIDAEVANAGKRRYVKITIDNPIAKYDFEKKGFPLDSSVWEPSSYRFFSDNGTYKVSFSNGSAFRYLTGVSEDSARTIEGLRSKYEPLHLVIYSYAQEADMSNKSIKSEIVKIALLDRKGNVLASQ